MAELQIRVNGEPEEHDSSDESELAGPEFPSKEGTLSKWTNYFYGWQNRFFILKNGFLSYYSSEEDRDKMCRGTMDIRHARLARHDIDVLRFSVCVGEESYYLRSKTPKDCEDWFAALEQTKASCHSTNLSRRPSEMSLVSLVSLASQNSTTSSTQRPRAHTERLADVRSYRALLTKQVDTLAAALAVPAPAAASDPLVTPTATPSSSAVAAPPAATPTTTTPATPLPAAAGGSTAAAAATVAAQEELSVLRVLVRGLIDAVDNYADAVSAREEELLRRVDLARERRRRAEAQLRQGREQHAALPHKATWLTNPDAQARA